MQSPSLQSKIDKHVDVVDMLRNSTVLPYIQHPVVPPEFYNWRDEQLAWRNSVVLLDQTHHMDALYISGVDAHRLISETSVTTPNFPVDSAKQYIAVNHDGKLIGDGIIHREAEDEFMYVGRSPAANWLHFNAATGGYNVNVEMDRRSLEYPLGRPIHRKFWRFQIQGPLAWSLIEKLNNGPVEQIKFFRESWMNIAGVRARTLRHGMAGAPGLEFWGPHDSYLRVRDAILAAGEEFGLVPVGSRAYPTAGIESGWIPSPLPAVYSGDSMRPYREWLPADSYEGRLTLAGSYVPQSVESYYLTPWDLRYGSFVKFDHSFIGEDALKAIDPETQRKKVTFEWHPDDVTKIFRSLMNTDGPHYKYLELPLSNYGCSGYDSVTDATGKLVGLSMINIGYSANERRLLSCGVVDANVPEGAELQLTWGEPDGGTKKRNVERHEQTQIRVIVSPSPYSSAARGEYKGGWRSAEGSSPPSSTSSKSRGSLEASSST